jgi:hypothetical protein
MLPYPEMLLQPDDGETKCFTHMEIGLGSDKRCSKTKENKAIVVIWHTCNVVDSHPND